jgi:transcriptional antiterminator
MNERIRKILIGLIKKPEIKMAELTQELSLTRRQINYALAQFNSELNERGLPEIKRSHTGDFMIPMEVLRFFSVQQSELKEGLSERILSEEERVGLLLSYLCTTVDYVSMNHLTDFLMISRNTVQEDLKRAERFVSHYSLTIRYNRQSGYQLYGLETRVLQLLSDLVKQYAIFRQEEIKEQLAPLISEDEVLHLIHNMEQMLHLSYSDESIDYLQIAVRLSLQRSQSNSLSSEAIGQGDIRRTPEYKFLKVLLQDSSWQGIKESYLTWLTLLFLTSNIFERRTTQVFDSDAELRQLIHDMVSNFEKQTMIVVEDRDAFERRILGHLRPACFRIKYNLSLGVYSLDSLVQDSNHAILNELMKELIVPTENWLGRAFPNDELELLSYYFGFQLTSPCTGVIQKPRAVVVCANGVMVSKLMRENLKKLFPEFHFLASFSVRDFHKFGNDYDMAFTTTPLISSMPQFIIDPIMTYKEQISLRYRVLNELGIN